MIVRLFVATSALLLLLAPTLAVSPPDGARSIKVDHVYFPSAMVIGDEEVAYRGGGLLKWYFWKVYTAAFYLPSDVPSDPSRFLGEEAAYLAIQYHREITAQDFIDITKEALNENPDTPWDELRLNLDKLYDMYEDVGSGDQYCIAVYPEGRTEIRLNGELRGTFEGRAFAEAFLGIWVSEHSLKPSFTDKLLGRS